MNKLTKKNKFVPPIKTAASFLKTISESSDYIKYESPTNKSKSIFELPQRLPTSPYSQNTLSLNIPKSQKTKSTRDGSRLQDLLKHSKSDLEFHANSSMFILPVEIDKLQFLLNPESSTEIRIKSKNSQILRIENESRSPFLKTGENFNNTDDFRGLSSHSDLKNLIDWFKYMKENVLSRIIDETKKKFKVFDPEKLENYETVVKAGIKEFIRQIRVNFLEKSEILNELIDCLDTFWISKLELAEKKFSENKSKEAEKIKNLVNEIQDNKLLIKEMENQFNKDIGVLKIEKLLKEEEIQKLQEKIKKLKADRILQSKKDLQKCNDLMKTVSTCISSSPDQDFDLLSISSALKKRKDSLISIILNKSQLHRSQTTEFLPRLTDQQLVEYESIITNSDNIFSEIAVQCQYSDFCKARPTQTFIYTQDASCETVEIFEVVVEEPDKAPSKPAPRFSIMITNEKEEQLESQHYSEVPEFQAKPESKQIGHIDIEPKRRRSIVGLYKTRETKSSSAQTDDRYFLEQVQTEEQEITEWIVNERKKKLVEIDREIIKSKKQLGKLISFISKHKDASQVPDISEHGIHDNSFDITEDTDLDHLKAVGIIKKDTDLNSWREGFSYGLSKANNSSIRKDSESSFEEPVKSKKKNLLGEDLEKMRRKSTKIEEFKFQRKEGKHQSYKPQSRPKFLEVFLETFKVSNKKIPTISKKNLLKTINSLYSSAVLKNNVFDFDSLHIFVYDDFISKYITKSTVDKKIFEFMTALLCFKDEKKIFTFNRLFGISAKIDVPAYSRPKQAFNFFVSFNRLLENSHLGIDVGEIKGKTFIPSSRAIECTKEIHCKFFETYKLQNLISNIEKNLILDPNKINKGLVDKEALIEILLDGYDDYNKVIEKFLYGLLDPLRFNKDLRKVHKNDLLMIIRFFQPDKYLKEFSGSPFECIEKITGHSKNKNLMSLEKNIDLLFQLKLLFPEDIKEGYCKAIAEDTAVNLFEVREEIVAFRSQVKSLHEVKEKLQFGTGYFNNWDLKLEQMLDKEKIERRDVLLLKLFTFEAKRVLGLFQVSNSNKLI